MKVIKIMMDYKVSVIIPTYKRSEYLQRAIESVLKQIYLNIEIVVVDDNIPGSDFRLKTERTMEKYSNNPQIIYLKNDKNLGGALARNEGIFKATGDYITFLDDDDIYLPNKIELQLKHMVENACDLTFTDVRLHDSSDNLIDYREHSYITDFSNEELLKQHIMHHLTPTATYMFKKASLLKINGFDDVEIGQEFMLMLKAIESGLKIRYMPIANVIQYIHVGERISVGQKKLSKEIELFNFKKKYFKILSYDQKKYVRFRHYVVMAVVGKRSKKFNVALINIFKALIVSPKYTVLECIVHYNKIKKYRLRETAK